MSIIVAAQPLLHSEP